MATHPYRHSPESTPLSLRTAAQAPSITEQPHIASPSPYCSIVTATLPRLLIVGESPIFDPILARASHPRCASVASCDEAEKLLGVLHFRLILADENIPGPSPYWLLPHLAGRDTTFYISLTLRHSTLWLPVLLDGNRAPGLAPIESPLLLAHMAKLLASSSIDPYPIITAVNTPTPPITGPGAGKDPHSYATPARATPLSRTFARAAHASSPR